MRQARSPAAAAIRIGIAGVVLFVLATACNRAFEPYDPTEQPEQPDLSRIFPEGAERATAQKAIASDGSPSAMPAADARGAPPAAAGSESPVSGTISLAPGLERKVPAGAILFVVARRGEGGGPPLAVKRV